MAYAAVASLLQTVDIILNHHQHSISPEFESQIKSIHQHTCSLRSFIEGSSARVNNWEETIREVTVRAEDIIELLLSDSLLGTSRSDELGKGKCEMHYSFDELEKVREEMESIVKKVMGRRRVEAGDGSDEELMEMISLLRGGSSSLEIIAICGSSGMGKTTLAEKAFVHPLIMERFDFRSGSIVTREGTLVRLIGELMRGMKADFSRSNSEEELIERLLQLLGGRRYLIWFDDVWSKDLMERLKMVLPDYGNGSRIIITTLSSEVAESAHHVHEMRLLDDDESWNMIRDTIFEGDPCPFQLESIGKTIAGCCGGNQLSIAVVSGILAADQSEAAWGDVLENIKVASGKVDEIVYLSYVYLPHHLRPCLLYLGIYRLGLYIYVSALVRMWVAEGFVNESEYKSFEETGEGYVEDLVKRRLVSVYTWKCNGRIKSIRVHDLVEGMCQRQARIDNFSHHFSSIWSSKEIIKSSRRVSNLNNCDDFLGGVYGSTIRTLYSSEDHKISWAFPLITLKKFVLKLRTNLSVGEEHWMSCATFPQTLKKLSLRGLQFSWEDMKMVASLPNLEVLKLRNHACVGDTWETSDGGFPRLLYLRIEESNLEKWITRSRHFPRLWWLVLVRCSSLLEVPYEMAGIPTLGGIFLDDTNQSLLRSVQRIQQDRHTLGHDPLHVEVL